MTGTISGSTGPNLHDICAAEKRAKEEYDDYAFAPICADPELERIYKQSTTDWSDRDIGYVISRDDVDGGIRQWNAAMAGDPEAAYRLLSCTTNALRPRLLIIAEHKQIPKVAFREMLTSCWDHDWHLLFRELTQNPGISARLELHRLFEEAAFDVSHLPKVVTCWRGCQLRKEEDTSELRGQVIERGFSWTLSRDVAHWFAWHNCHHVEDAFVARAEFPREVVLAHITTRQEDEIIVCHYLATEHYGQDIDYAIEPCDPSLAREQEEANKHHTRSVFQK